MDEATCGPYPCHSDYYTPKILRSFSPCFKVYRCMARSYYYCLRASIKLVTKVEVNVVCAEFFDEACSNTLCVCAVVFVHV